MGTAPPVSSPCPLSAPLQALFACRMVYPEHPIAPGPLPLEPAFGGAIMMKRILVVDDNQAVRLVVRSALEMHGPYIVHEAVDGLDAVQKAETLNPDLVIMDLSMPRMHGIAATRKLKESRPPVHVVLFTMHKGVLTESEAASAGLDAVVSKSDGIESLFQQVQQILN